MINNFERIREKLHESIEKNGINSEKTKRISERFDKLVNSYYINERKYNTNCLMYIKYTESIKHMKKITTEFAKFPSIDEWNKYAKEELLLCSESLKCISGLNWHDLRNRIISEI